MFDTSDTPKVKVLIIDDSRLVRIAASKMLGDEFNIVLAVDGVDGWNVIQSDPDIQVVFTDLVMPEMDGFELLKTIRMSNKEAINSLPVIVATGADNPEIAKQKAISLGATDFITKPFDATAIKARALAYANFHSANKKLKEQTTIDVLTGLLNTRGLHKQLDKELSFVSRHKSTMTTMTIQVDKFKDLFIRVGRSASEVIISKIAQVISRCVRKEDTVARVGVSEFVVTMPLAGAPNALEISDKVCRTVESFRAKQSGKKLDITVSIGICSLETVNDEVTVPIVLDVSDQALQKAKLLGRSQIAQMAMSEYLGIQARKAVDSLSIDDLLEKIKRGNNADVTPCLDTAVERLTPLLAMLNHEQKQRLLVASIPSKTEGLPKTSFNL